MTTTKMDLILDFSCMLQQLLKTVLFDYISFLVTGVQNKKCLQMLKLRRLATCLSASRYQLKPTRLHLT